MLDKELAKGSLIEEITWFASCSGFLWTIFVHSFYAWFLCIPCRIDTGDTIKENKISNKRCCESKWNYSVLFSGSKPPVGVRPCPVTYCIKRIEFDLFPRSLRPRVNCTRGEQLSKPWGTPPSPASGSSHKDAWQRKWGPYLSWKCLPGPFQACTCQSWMGDRYPWLGW
jgi:hypothetical protein